MQTPRKSNEKQQSSRISVEESALRDEVYQRLGAMVATLGSPVRLKLIQQLAQAPRSVEELSRRTGESTANTSQHLQRMVKEGLLSVRKEGLSRIYQVRSPSVLALWESIQDLGRELSLDLQLAEEKLTDFALKSEVPSEEVLRLIREKKAILLDVRDVSESQASPVLGSVAISLSELKDRLSDLPAKKAIYVFCRGRYCSLASDAVRLLRKNGFRSYRLSDSSFRLNQVLLNQVLEGNA